MVPHLKTALCGQAQAQLAASLELERTEKSLSFAFLCALRGSNF